jgi:hypothetical protein
LRSSIRREARLAGLTARPLLAPAFALFALVAVLPAFAAQPLPAGYKLIYEQTCATASALRDFAMTDPAAWRLSRTDRDAGLELFKQSDYQPAVRSPFNIALVADKVFGDFILEVELMSTFKDYPHRDMCLCYDIRDPAHFYYTHIATGPADPHAHNIFIVSNAPRLAIGKPTTRGANWGRQDQWHRIRIERTAADGTIKVYFDDFSNPIMTATDKTFGSGYIGFGSFDETGMVRNIKIWGPSVETRTTTFFKRPPG